MSAHAGSVRLVLGQDSAFLSVWPERTLAYSGAALTVGSRGGSRDASRFQEVVADWPSVILIKSVRSIFDL